ncbi:MAG: hypothetical protein KGL95_01370 [Patescibacteria group bacterium]|nr:hypothetical protein [Patescibacteria group bacterium]
MGKDVMLHLAQEVATAREKIAGEVLPANTSEIPIKIKFTGEQRRDRVRGLGVLHFMQESTIPASLNGTLRRDTSITGIYGVESRVTLAVLRELGVSFVRALSPNSFR